MPEIGQYTSRIMPPQGRTIPPHIGRAQSTASGIAAEGVYGIGKVLTDSGARFLEMISDAQDSVEFSKVQMDANQIHNALTDTLQTTWDDDTRKQLAEKSFNDTTAILETIRRPNVQKMFKKYLNEITPHWQADFNKIDWRMKIDKMKADTRILDEYDYEHGNKENLRMRHERNRDMGIETPIETESIIKNYDVNSALYRSRVDIGSNEPLRVKGAIEDLEKARPSMSGAQLDEADSLLAMARRQQSEFLRQIQEETSRTLLADLWDNKLTDPQIITNAVRSGIITDTNAKYLRNALLNQDPPTLNLKSLADVKEAITDIGTGAKTRSQALEILYKNLDGIDPTTGKSLVAEIFTEQDRSDAGMKREGRDLMEQVIRDRDKFSGFFTDDERQIFGTAEAVLMLDAEIEKAAREKKPLNRRDILIKAVEVGRQIKSKIKREEADSIPAGFEPETEGYPVVPKAPDFTAKGKPIVKGALARPDFVMDDEGEPEKVFDSEGRETGLRRKTGAVFGIGYRAVFSDKTYEYTGNGNWKIVE